MGPAVAAVGVVSVAAVGVVSVVSVTARAGTCQAVCRESPSRDPLCVRKFLVERVERKLRGAGVSGRGAHDRCEPAQRALLIRARRTVCPRVVELASVIVGLCEDYVANQRGELSVVHVIAAARDLGRVLDRRGPIAREGGPAQPLERFGRGGGGVFPPRISDSVCGVRIVRGEPSTQGELVVSCRSVREFEHAAQGRGRAFFFARFDPREGCVEPSPPLGTVGIHPLRKTLA